VRYVFGSFELDTQRAELRCEDIDVAIEPKAYSLLCLLADNHDRMVTKDEIVEKIWDGRAVSDSVVSTGIKGVRRALGDDGDRQLFVKTIRGRGFRFIAPVKLISDQISANPLNQLQQDTERPEQGTKPSIAILPFKLVGFSEKYGAIADAIPVELISSLSRLRWLTVVARGSTFRFRGPETDLSDVRSLLGATYCLSGIVEIFGPSLTISVELSDAKTQAVVWCERFQSKIDSIHEIRAQIVDNTIAAMELRIPLHEAGKARLMAPESLDAWGVYHLGLQYMYRFNKTDNDIAAGHFQRATELDPHFSRAYAARSFTSFQKAFLKNSNDVELDKKEARKFAEKSLELDPLDPFGNFTFGRSFWLEGEPDGALNWLDRAIDLSPNFAQGYYARSWTDIMGGRGKEALSKVAKSIDLSPVDPFLYAMQSVRGMAFVLDGDYENGAIWADKGARAPGAHFLIGVIAAATHQMNGDNQMVKYWVDNVRSRRSDASLDHFFTAFPFQKDKNRGMWSDALVECGF